MPSILLQNRPEINSLNILLHLEKTISNQRSEIPQYQQVHSIPIPYRPEDKELHDQHQFDKFVHRLDPIRARPCYSSSSTGVSAEKLGTKANTDKTLTYKTSRPQKIAPVAARRSVQNPKALRS